MLRSFHYAEAEAMKGGAPVHAGWAKEAGRAFVTEYQRALAASDLLPASEATFDAVLGAVELEKALYEVRYELKSRPQMVNIPASRVLEIAAA
jgi:predicted trehalose synthase